MIARAERSAESRGRGLWLILLLLSAVVLLVFRLWHIRADFTASTFYSQDSSRYSDEGFYTGAALHYFTLGRAYIPGGWNPGVFMPVWPFLVGLVFHFSGISVVAARSLAVVCTWIGVLLAYGVARQYRSRTFACWTAFLAAANALGFFFGRQALLEPAFVMFLLLAIYVAGRVRPGNYGLAVAVGIAFILSSLTKSTAAFALPAVLYPVWANNRARSGTRRFDEWKLLGTILLTVALGIGGAKLIWMHYQADARIILGMAPLWQIEHSPARLLRFFFRGTWIDPVQFPLAVACFVAAIGWLRFLWRDTLFVTALLWETGYAAFIVFHYDGPPRYFVVMIVPTIWLALIFSEWLLRAHRRAGAAVAACIAISVIWNIASIANYLLHPRYSLVNASVAIKQVILVQQKIDPGWNALLIGRNAEEVSLLSGGLKTMDTDGAMLLAEKLDVYHPGWFMDWTDDLPLRAATVAEHRRMVDRADFPRLNTGDGAGIVLYQLFPKSH